MQPMGKCLYRLVGRLYLKCLDKPRKSNAKYSRAHTLLCNICFHQKHTHAHTLPFCKRTARTDLEVLRPWNRHPTGRSIRLAPQGAPAFQLRFPGRAT
eukprot:1157521-Pelagomonas_calceolata.AAC.11